MGKDGGWGLGDAGGMVLMGYFLGGEVWEGSCVGGEVVWVGLDT